MPLRRDAAPDAPEAAAGAADAAAPRDAAADATTVHDAGDSGPVGAADAGTSSGGLTRTKRGLLVAFLGDQGNGVNADAVLALIQAEGADAVLHSGDFDYVDDPAAWEARIDAVLGADFPYLSTVGNHDAAAWSGDGGYQARIAARITRTPTIDCEGEVGVSAVCEIQGLRIVQSCVGVTELDPVHCAADAPEQVAHLEAALSERTHVWNVCSWHKNQHDMQVGTKGDEVGYAAYQTCMDLGAIIVTAHEHSYARTATLTDVGNALAGHGALMPLNFAEVTRGKTFVVVSGLGGRGMRAFSTSHASDTWWATFATSNRWFEEGREHPGDHGDFGALFIRFYVDDDPQKARAYFKDVRGRVLDAFDVYTY